MKIKVRSLWIAIVLLTLPQLHFAQIRSGSTANIPVLDSNRAFDEVSLFPNPFNLFLTVVIHNTTEINNYSLRLYNITGSEIMRLGFKKRQTSFSMAHLQPGVYFYRIMANHVVIQSGTLISHK